MFFLGQGWVYNLQLFAITHPAHSISALSRCHTCWLLQLAWKPLIKHYEMQRYSEQSCVEIILSSHCCVWSAIWLNFHQGRDLYMPPRLIRYSCIYDACLHGLSWYSSSRLWKWEVSYYACFNINGLCSWSLSHWCHSLAVAIHTFLLSKSEMSM